MFFEKVGIPSLLDLRTLITILPLLLLPAACQQAGGDTAAVSRNSTPTEAYTNLYNAVKAKDTDAIKRNLTKKSIELGHYMVNTKSKNSLDEALANGLTATTFSATLPTIRDERINGNMGAIEVWNSKESKWEDLPFILEDGSWKLAFGEQFAGTYVSPGKGRDVLEKEAANLAAPTPKPSVAPLSTNSAASRAISNIKKK